MSHTSWKTLATPLAGGLCLAAAAATAPDATLTNAHVRVRLYLHDAQAGFYRGTRFDWSGVIASLEYAGHEYYPQWFDRMSPDVHDFVYDGDAIVAGPCTAITGPSEEFSTDGKGLGFDEAKPGGTFIKIGVGVLRRPDDRPYDPYRLYPIHTGGTWTLERKPAAIEFRQVLADTSTGYAYEYRKTVALAGDQPRLILDHTLRNTGTRVIATSVYNHNFLYLDRQPPGPEVTLTFPFNLRAAPASEARLATLTDRQITFTRKFTGEDRVYLSLQGFGADPRDHDFRLEHRGLGAGVRITGDRPLSRLALWAIRAPLSLEPFIDMSLAPGAEFAWRTQYEYYTLPKADR